MRLVESSHYSDAALSVYVKVKALGLRAEGCTAALRTLATYLGFSVSTVQRGLAELRSPAPDGVVELPDSTRRSLKGGSGTTARRRVRPMRPSERFIWLPVVASEHLTPRLLRAYAVISYAVIQKVPLTARMLAGFLRHHSGPRTGQPLGVKAAGRIIDDLDTAGWISLDRRAGARGRHLFLVHSDRRQADPTPDLDDRSGADSGDRSLAYKEDLRTDRLENERAPGSPAAGDVPVDKADEAPGKAAGTPRPAAATADRALRADDTIAPAHSPTAADRAVPDRRSYTGPQLTFSPRLHDVLEPVRFLLAGVNTYVLRRIGREIGRRLDDGTTVERLRARLTLRLARTVVDDIRDPGRWLLGVALPRWGCADPDCEAGMLWSTRTECGCCREVLAQRAAARRQAAQDLSRRDSPEPTADLSRRDNPKPTADLSRRDNPEPTADLSRRDNPEPTADLSRRDSPEPTADLSRRDKSGRGSAPVSRAVTCCPDCERPHLPGKSGPCADCRTRSAPSSALAVTVLRARVPSPAAASGIRCRGRHGTCGRPAFRGQALCWRCRVEAERESETARATTGRPGPTS